MIAFDKAFVSNCRKGERNTQKQLFERLYAPMYRLCFRYIGRQAEAEDCLMKGFMKAFQHIGKFEYQGEHSLFYWVKKLMVNESLMELRRISSLNLVPQTEMPEIAEAEDILARLSAEEIYEMVTELPSGYRTVFNLNIIEGYAHNEIAELLGITESTSRSQLVKARNLLRSRIEQRREMYERKRG